MVPGLRRNPSGQKREKSAFREYAESIIFAVVLALILRQFVVQAFKIPSGSMEDTLLIGDHILVNKFLYHFTDPKQLDVIVFRYPWDDERDFIKRVIALPGDRVEVRNRRVYVNGEALEQEWYLHGTASLGHENFGPIVVPREGDTVEIRQDQNLYLNNERVSIPSSSTTSGLFDPLGPSQLKDGFETFYGWLFPRGTTLQQPVGPITVEHDYYFTLGDNRRNSRDSRFWGLVPSTRIKGKAFFIYWSWNRTTSFPDYIRWDRLGKLLQPPGL